MIFDEKGFEKEIAAIKGQGGFGDNLSDDSKQSVRSKVMQAISSAAVQAQPVYSWRQKYHTAIRYAVSVVVGLSLVGGTTFASNGTVPGDPLYSVKRVKEKIELTLALSDASKTGLEAKFAEDRLTELHALMAKFMQQGGPKNSAIVSGSGSTTPANIATSTEENNSGKGNELEIKAEADASSQVNTALTKLKHLQAKFTASGQTEAAAAIQINIVDLQNKAFLENVELDDDTASTTGSVKGASDDKRPNNPKKDKGLLNLQTPTGSPSSQFKVNVKINPEDMGNHANDGDSGN
jgi:hypothetical protein